MKRSEATSTAGEAPHAGPPGVFFHLVRAGLVDEATLAPLYALLPAREAYVSTPERDGEAFESTRWPQRLDAALATFAVRRCPDPGGHIARALAALDALADDACALRALARNSCARALASLGGDAQLLLRLWPDATAADRALFDAPACPLPAAQHVADLHAAHHEARNGLYAYHVHRGIPGPAADAAERLVRAALSHGLTTAALVAEAVALAAASPAAP